MPGRGGDLSTPPCRAPTSENAVARSTGLYPPRVEGFEPGPIGGVGTVGGVGETCARPGALFVVWAAVVLCRSLSDLQWIAVKYVPPNADCLIFAIGLIMQSTYAG